MKPGLMRAMPLVWMTLLLTGCGATDLAREAAPTRIRVMTWNIHHGEGHDGRLDLDRIAAVIRSENADLVALQEVDRGVNRTAGRDLPAELALLTGMTCVFSNNYHHGGGEYGNAVLSRYPVTDWSNTHYTMLTPAEQRGVIRVRVAIAGRELVLFNTHFDAQRGDEERLSEAGQLLDIAGRHRGGPLLICGDFNATPGSPVLAGFEAGFDDAWSLAGQGDGSTIPVTGPSRRIDYIWMGPGSGMRITRTWVPVTPASDHLPVVAEMEFLR
jgi:endonuclease/exonuclease/phosphatase family metal-dependent hydrolase